MEPDVCSRIIEGYRQQELSSYNLKEDPNYLVELLLRKIKKVDSFKCEIDHPTSIVATREIIDIFKDWVENNRGWAEIQDAPSNKREKAVQRFMHLGAKYYVEINNLDFSCEPDEGRGPVDIKLSRGTDKTLAEIKLSSNAQCVHGYESQIKEYSKAERTNNLIFVFVDVGNPGRRKSIIELYNNAKMSGKPYPELIIIDAREKKAASTFNSESWNIDWREISSIDLKDFDLDFSSVDFGKGI